LSSWSATTWSPTCCARPGGRLVGLSWEDAGCTDALTALAIAMHTEYGHGLARVRRVAQAALPTNAAAARRLRAEVLGVTPPSSP
jgi:hypothetical protein